MSLERSTTKRPRWTVNAQACDFCRRRKSRCRVTSISGACERCRESDQQCSLQTEDDPDEITDMPEVTGQAGSSSQLWDHINESRRLLIRLDKRTKDLMNAFRDQEETQVTSLRRPIPIYETLGREFSGIREDGVGDDEDIEEGIQDLLSRRLGTSLLYVTGINLHDRTSFIDPVGAALITESGMRAVMERFHECMDKICPVKELLGDLIDENHPFLRSCVLPYLTFMRSNDEDDLRGHLKAQSVLQDNLDRLTPSNPALPIIIGLTILSLSPTSGFEKRYARQVDGARHILRAVDMSLADGLDDSAVIGLRQPPSALANEPWLHTEKCKIMLWYLVSHRAAWVEILTSPSLSARPFLTPQFLAIFPSKPQHSALLLHLYHDSRLLSLLGHFATSFRRARQTTAYDSFQLQGLRFDLLEFRNARQAWQREVETENLQSGPFLVFNSLLVEILVYFKITTDCATHAPTPLSPDDRFTFFRDCLNDIRARAVDCIAYATAARMDLGVLPAFHLTLAFLPFKILRAASQIDPAGSGGMFNTQAVAHYRGMLSSSHSLGGSMVEHIESHVPTQGWKHLVDSLEQGAAVGDENLGPDDFAELFRTICESDAFLDFQHQPHL